MGLASHCAILGAILVALVATLLPLALRVEYPVLQGGNVLVTGTSSGIGRSAALRLLREGYEVYAGVRKESHAKELQLAAGELVSHLHPVILDVARPETLTAVVEQLSATGVPLTALVNNAGVQLMKPTETVSLDSLRALYDVNFFGVVDLTQRTIPLLRQSAGRIVNVGSVSGVVPASPLNFPYASSKHALEALTDSLRVEVRPFNMSVSIVDPGYITTEISKNVSVQVLDTTEKEQSLYGRFFEHRQVLMKKSAVLAEACCQSTDDAIIHALQDPFPRTRYIVSNLGFNAPGWFAVLMIRLLSAHPVMDRLVDLFQAPPGQ
mmetsp:Transcript_25982/g.68162  ORF Transcript_25982/g.68162 Transcript_25982/m.68162 type:complete len:323 (-) Transcript_25982:74-1042(-)